MITARAGAAALLVLGLVSGTTACGGDSGSGTAATVPSVPATSTPTPTPSPTTNGIDTLPPYDAQVAAREAFLTAPAVRLTGQVGARCCAPCGRSSPARRRRPARKPRKRLSWSCRRPASSPSNDRGAFAAVRPVPGGLSPHAPAHETGL